MNKAKLKSYAPKARLDFIAAVTARANLLGLAEKAGRLEVAPAQTQGDVTLIAGQAWPAKVAAQREQLIARMHREGLAQTCEAIAYTWFNRFAALRYMELHAYLGHGHRALSSAESKIPDILTHASELAHSSDSGLPGLRAELVTEMKLAGNRDSELYRMLLVAQCNALSSAMPFLFERIDDDSELLLPDNLLRSDSVIAKLVEEIPEEDWAEVEIIGWLYQFYISDKKDQVIGKVVKSEDIPAATQLFTPNWIVQYLVQNSVGRLWMMANPQSTLAKNWPYYITLAEQTPEVKAQLDALIQARVYEDGDTLNPESITVLDPACGSGHILVVAYDVLKAIYLERGYQPRAIPRLILEKNLYGLDIDDRAAQMAGFALMMKARADDHRLFSESVNLNVLSLQESNGLDANILIRSLEEILDSSALKADLGGIGIELAPQDLFPESHLQSSLGESNSENKKSKEFGSIVTMLIKTFTDAKTFGSLITVPEQLRAKLLWLQGKLSLALQKGDLYVKLAAQDLMPLTIQAHLISLKFDAVVANPPYMGGKGMNAVLKDFAKTSFPDSKSDLLTMFMERGFGWCKASGFNSMVTMQSWMFLSSFEAMREKILEERTLQTMAHFGARAFSEIPGEVVQTTAFVFQSHSFQGFKPTFFRLVDGQEEEKKSDLQLQRNRFDLISQDEFAKIPGSPIAYWTSTKVLSIFEKWTPISDHSIAVKGLDTCDNDQFVRRWYEPSICKVGLHVKSTYETADALEKWYPYCKGGPFRRWAGNVEHVVNWENDGVVLRNLRDENGGIKSRPQSTQHYFRDGITFGAITSSDFACRAMRNSIFGGGGSAVFAEDPLLVLGFLNSKLVGIFTKILNPTLNMLVGDILKLPYFNQQKNSKQIQDVVTSLVTAFNQDWDEFETALGFERISIISNEISLEKSWYAWEKKCINRISVAINLETKNNFNFIQAYGLEDELSPEVSESQITLARADREKDSQRLISYAIGCMMGRYSLDKLGLIYAHMSNIDFDPNRYSSFPADTDGIVPITDELWFDEDASNRIREFLRAVWGFDTLEENILWLAQSLGAKSSETPDETIRRYIADKFFKDHLQTYKKRPIYWLFSSGKQGAFQALVYLHRYNEGTLARMRAEYVIPLISKIQSRIEMLEKDVNATSSTATRNKLAKEVEKLKKKHLELLAFDEQLRHYADMRITLDLDDGVKVNYGKFGDLLAEVKAVTGGASDE